MEVNVAEATGTPPGSEKNTFVTLTRPLPKTPTVCPTMPDPTEVRVGGTGCKCTIVDAEPVASVTLADTVSCADTVPCGGAEYKPLLLIVPMSADH